MGDSAVKMKIVCMVVFLGTITLSILNSFAQGDLKITNLNLVPIPSVQEQMIQLHMSGSYKVEVRSKEGDKVNSMAFHVLLFDQNVSGGIRDSL